MAERVYIQTEQGNEIKEIDKKNGKPKHLAHMLV